jgi:hypothetical protein
VAIGDVKDLLKVTRPDVDIAFDLPHRFEDIALGNFYDFTGCFRFGGHDLCPFGLLFLSESSWLSHQPPVVKKHVDCWNTNQD